jgi:hypothetical protein
MIDFLADFQTKFQYAIILFVLPTHSIQHNHLHFSIRLTTAELSYVKYGTRCFMSFQFVFMQSGWPLGNQTYSYMPSG